MPTVGGSPAWEVEIFRALAQLVAVVFGVAVGWMVKERRARSDRIREARAVWAAATKAYLTAAATDSRARRNSEHAIGEQRERLYRLTDMTGTNVLTAYERLVTASMTVRVLDPRFANEISDITSDVLALDSRQSLETVERMVLEDDDRLNELVSRWVNAGRLPNRALEGPDQPKQPQGVQ